MPWFRLSPSKPWHYVAGAGSVSLCNVRPTEKAFWTKQPRTGEAECINCGDLFAKLAERENRNAQRRD